LDWGADGKDQAQKGKIEKKGADSLLHLSKFGDLEAVESPKQGQPRSMESGSKIQFFPSKYTEFTSFTSLTTVSSILDRIEMICQLGYSFQNRIPNTLGGGGKWFKRQILSLRI
jgi:hypothetical protein